MIIDSIKSFEKYKDLAKGFDKVYTFLKDGKFNSLQEGKYEIDGSRVYCTISVQKLRDVSEAPLEIHDSYIDIHVILQGDETIGHKDRALCSNNDVKYNEADDIAFLNGDTADNYLSLGSGNLAIIFPADAHAPLIGEGEVKKAVFKVFIPNPQPSQNK